MQDTLDLVAYHPPLAKRAVRVSYECCGRYALEGLVYCAAPHKYAEIAPALGLAVPVPHCVLQAVGAGLQPLGGDDWHPSKHRRRFLRRYRELTGELTRWDRLVIRVRNWLGKDGCR